MPTATQLEPAIKYPGSKRRLIDRLQKYYSAYSDRPLVELFAGSAAVSLGLQPKSAVLIDINPHVVNFHQQLKAGLKPDPSVEWQNDEMAYYRNREWFRRLKDKRSPLTANLFYYLNKTGYNGLCRFNQKGEYNVPFGRYKSINYCTDFTPWQQAYKNFEFVCGDFEDVGREAIAPGDFIYCDPPYDGDFTAYAGNKFGWDEQVRLAHYLAALPCPVLASNAATPRIIDLYESLGFEVEYISVSRSISCTGDRADAAEVLMFKGV
jgi:DNA adenine methylase